MDRLSAAINTHLLHRNSDTIFPDSSSSPSNLDNQKHCPKFLRPTLNTIAGIFHRHCNFTTRVTFIHSCGDHFQ